MKQPAAPPRAARAVRTIALAAVVVAVGWGRVGPAAAAPAVMAASAHVLQAPRRISAPDSADLRRRARNAQAAFERRRRRLSPVTRDGRGSGCDERIGRICFSYGEGDWRPRPDPPALWEAREELIAILAEVGEAIPGDAWVMGQRVRYLAEAGRWGEAGRLATECRAGEPWWCPALLGFVLHGVGRHVEAIEAFERALAAMDAERREAWTDVEPLLDGDARSLWKAAREADEREGSTRRRDELRRRLWTLADPLLARPGNDRLSEHYARRVMVEIQRNARNPWSFGWGWDLEELLVRYGWERGWERRLPRPGALTDGEAMVGHTMPHQADFLPPGRVLEAPTALVEGAWTVDYETPRSGYQPPGLARTLPGRAQIAVLRRGDSLVVLAAAELPPDPDEERPPGERGDRPDGSRGAGGEAAAQGPRLRPPWSPPPPLDEPRARSVLAAFDSALVEAARTEQDGTDARLD
ncbi:MAG: hypothetical protein D6701_14795, partial [Gemmatimonadetes bacterium]